jgi:formate hydrogenlyase transcriptional activator
MLTGIEHTSISMTAAENPGVPQTASLQRYQLLLEMAKAANSCLEFNKVLRALGQRLSRIQELRSVAVLVLDGDYYRPYSLHVNGLEAVAGESFGNLLSRSAGLDANDVPERIPMANSVMEHIFRTRRPYICPDLARMRRFADEPRLLTYGIGAYVLCPLLACERMLGAIHFIHEKPREYTAEEVSLLSDIGELSAVAVANALAYEEIDTLRQKLQSENLVLKENIADDTGSEELVGSSSGLKGVLAAIDKVAATDSTVLILGETGTGKELVAKAIHRKSRRSGSPMVKVNCAAIPEPLIASELFGHERGAFTGAMQRRIGRFEMANHSSLFLDEVGELPLEMQVTLLRVLQEHEFERVGGSQTIRTDARVITATNRDLPQSIADGRFRSDLYYRLNVFPIQVPALRERREDIPILAEYFISRCAGQMGKKIEHIDRAAMDLLIDYHWPGNIRELQNVIERAVILAESSILRIDSGMLGINLATESISPTDVLHQHERELIESALAETRGRIAGSKGAAARLRLPASTLESKIRALGIDKHKHRSRSN